MSANMQAAAPFEPEKAGWLHDQERLPDPPANQQPWRLYVGFILGAVVIGVLLTALGLEIRDGWESHRDWVVPVIAQFACIAGAAVIHLIYRGSLGMLGLGLLFLIFTLILLGMNLSLEGNASRETAEDWLSATAGIMFGVTLAIWIIGSIWAEYRYPTEGPEREAAF